MTIIPIDKLAGYIWINGELVGSQDAKIPILTHGLHYSGGVFEGERAYAAEIFKLEEHTDRLIASSKVMQMQSPYSFDQIIAAHKLVIKKNNIQNAYLRPLIWRGAESLNLTNKVLSVNLMIAAIPLTQKPEKSFKLHISRWKKPHPQSLPPQVKSSGHYNMMIVSQMEAQALGYDDAILLDWRDFIAECTTTNIFFVHKEQLITPVADAFLNGITRQTIIGLAKKLGLEVKEQHFGLEKLAQFDECFMTGTAAEVKSVQSIDLADKKINFDNNRITSMLHQQYLSLVNPSKLREDCQ